MSDMTVQDACTAILQQPCPYKAPPLSYINGHQFCPCICQAIRLAYLGGYAAAMEGKPPEVGVVEKKDEKPVEGTNESGC